MTDRVPLHRQPGRYTTTVSWRKAVWRPPFSVTIISDKGKWRVETSEQVFASLKAAREYLDATFVELDETPTFGTTAPALWKRSCSNILIKRSRTVGSPRTTTAKATTEATGTTAPRSRWLPASPRAAQVGDQWPNQSQLCLIEDDRPRAGG